jgi:hypothetical protein
MDRVLVKNRSRFLNRTLSRPLMDPGGCCPRSEFSATSASPSTTGSSNEILR